MNVPHRLLEIQRWFAKTITYPLTTEDAPFQEAFQYIAPSHALKPHQRIKIYHQQYWWRLLDTLQQNFPMVTRLFGYTSFNKKIGIPYLSERPSAHWELSRLGETLPQWIQEKYPEKDKKLVVSCAEIDWVCQKAFWIPVHPPLQFHDLTTKKLTLQPHVEIFELEADLFTFRDEFLKKEVNHWDTNPFPKVEYGKSYFMLYRSLSNHVKWKPLSYEEYCMLLMFKTGATVDEVCAQAEERSLSIDDTIAQWFQEWTILNLFELKQL